MKTRSLAPLIVLTLLAVAAQGLGQATAPASDASTWGAKDTHGNGVALPADRTTVLVFLRPGQPQSADAMAAIAPILRDRKDVQVIGIVSGDDSAMAAAKLDKSGWTYPIVADETYDTSGKFSVRVWPTLLVAGRKGEEIARMPGLPVSLANDLAAYLDFASGKLDKAGLDKALTNREMVGDSEDEKAARHAEVAQRLAQQGLSTQATSEVAKAMELKPRTGPLLASLARTDLILGDAKGAGELLGRLRADDVPPQELNTLKGWAALQGARWDEARKLLEDATRLNPDPAEALYLLGRVYDHDGYSPKAAEAYRKAYEHTADGKAISGK
jgi:tetratricopeptide (TPR) repeat protein